MLKPPIQDMKDLMNMDKIIWFEKPTNAMKQQAKRTSKRFFEEVWQFLGPEKEWPIMQKKKYRKSQ